MHAAQSYGMTDNTLPAQDRLPGHDDLRGAEQEGRVEPLLLHRPARGGAVGRARRWRARAACRSTTSAARRARCRALSFVDPSFEDEGSGTSGDEHPHGDVRTGQAFMADVVHAFMESPQWKRGALFIVYDEWGGFFDHVRPPRVPDIRSSSRPHEGLRADGLPHPRGRRSRPWARRRPRGPHDLRLRVDPEDDRVPLRARRR